MNDETEKMEPQAEPEFSNGQPMEEIGAQAGFKGKCFQAAHWFVKHKPWSVAIPVALVVAIVSVGWFAYAMAPSQTNEPEAQKTTTTTTSTKAKESKVKATVEAEGTDKDATKVKVTIIGEEETGDGVEKVAVAEREITANESVELGSLEEGKYAFCVTQAPVCKDGSTFELPEEPMEFSVDGQGEEVTVKVTLDKLAVEDMTKEQLEAAAEILATTGNTDAAESVVEKAKTAASVEGSASSVKTEVQASTNTTATTPSTEKPKQHVHNWVADYTMVDNWVNVLVSAEWDEPVRTPAYDLHVCGCGATFHSARELAAHADAAMDNEDYSHGGGHVETIYETTYIHHDAVYQMVNQPIKKLTGYHCECGATK